MIRIYVNYALKQEHEIVNIGALIYIAVILAPFKKIVN